MTWTLIALGWPAVATSIVLTIVAIFFCSWRLALGGALLALPFMLYMFAAPRFRLLAPAIVISHLCAAWALHRGSRTFGFVLFLPFACFAVFVAYLVWSQSTG